MSRKGTKSMVETVSNLSFSKMLSVYLESLSEPCLFLFWVKKEKLKMLGAQSLDIAPS